MLEEKWTLGTPAARPLARLQSNYARGAILPCEKQTENFNWAKIWKM